MNRSGLRGDSNSYRGNGIGNGDGNGNSSNHNHISNPLPFWVNHRKKLASAQAFAQEETSLTAFLPRWAEKKVLSSS